MSCRVRRVIMVNLGTPKRGVSQRITEIDPRGGAAVIGPNGVGKTTTLRLIPLFYGALPSTLVSKAGGQSGMIPFVLPTPRSALVFEYQRGPAEDDVRMVVMRRRGDGTESAEYRLFRCGFKRELFVQDEHFLDDDGTKAAADGLQIAYTEKLTAAEYRHVILGIKAQNQRQADLRRMSREFALGPKSLTNLDRLVAAMVKDDVNFTDLVQVAVGMVLEGIGSRSEDRDRVALRQSRRQIQLWIQDRRACAEARNLAGDAHNLKTLVNKVHQDDAALREFSAEVEYLEGVKRKEEAEVSAALEQLATSRRAAVEAEGEVRSRIEREVSQAREATHRCDSEHATAVLYQEEFQREKAQEWAGKIEAIPALQGRLRATRVELNALTAASSAIDIEIQAERERIGGQKQEELARRPLLEKPIRDQQAAALEALEREEEGAASVARQEHDGIEDGLRESLGAQLEALGAIRLKVEDPRISPVTVQAVEEAEKALNEAQSALTEAMQRASTAAATVKDKVAAFTAADAGVQAALAQERRADEELTAARALLAPADGSLLAVLKGADGDLWKPTLAKLVNPALLSRTDLDPGIEEQGVKSAYGWTLNSDAIETPAWADDDLQQAAMKSAEAALEAARTVTAQRRKERESTSAAVQQAEEAAAAEAAREGIARQGVTTRETAVLVARDKRSRERGDMRAKAQEELKRAEGEIAEVRRQLETLKRSFNAAGDQRKAAFQSRRSAIQETCLQGLREVESGIQQRLAALDTALEGLNDLRRRRLAESGVDLARVDELNREVGELDTIIRVAESKQHLVARWREFMEQGGAERVAKLKAALETARSAQVAAERRQHEHDKSCEASAKAYREADEAAQQTKANTARDIARLSEMAIELQSYPARYGVKPDNELTAESLGKKVKTALSTIVSDKVALDKAFSGLKNRLTGQEGNVRDLVEQALGAVGDASVERRASALLEAMAKVEQQVVQQVGGSLRTMLEGIGSFRDTIQRFETEVERLNTQLQRGLRQVEAFPRLRDLELRMTTDFGTLDVVRKVAKLDELRSTAKVMAHDTTWLPDEKAELAMSDFMATIEDSGRTEVSLASRVTLRGKVTENGQVRAFSRAEALKHVSSTGLSSLVLITLLVGLLNMIRGEEEVYVAWITDEVMQFDPENFAALLQMLRQNRIDVVTASPDLGVLQYRRFERRYQMADGGRLIVYTAANGEESKELAA